MHPTNSNYPSLITSNIQDTKMSSPYVPPVTASTPRTHPCPLAAEESCPLMFAAAKHARHHAISMHDGLPCKFAEMADCAARCYSQADLDDHHEWFPHAALPLPCPMAKWRECPRRCADTADVRAHLRAVHPDEIYACPKRECEEVFLAPGFVKKHVRSAHVAKESFACPRAREAGCVMMFRSPDGAKKHVDKMHSGLSVACPGREEWGCERKFESQEMADIHAMHSHKGKPPRKWLIEGKRCTSA